MKEPDQKLGESQDQEADSEESQLAFSFLQKELEKTHPTIVLDQVLHSESQPVAGIKVLLRCSYHYEKKDLSKKETEQNELQAIILIDFEDNCELLDLNFGPEVLHQVD